MLTVVNSLATVENDEYFLNFLALPAARQKFSQFCQLESSSAAAAAAAFPFVSWKRVEKMGRGPSSDIKVLCKRINALNGHGDLTDGTEQKSDRLHGEKSIRFKILTSLQKVKTKYGLLINKIIIITKVFIYCEIIFNGELCFLCTKVQ